MAELIAAVKAGSAEEVLRLIREGADICARDGDDHGPTALHISASLGCDEILLYLIGAGADLESTCFYEFDGLQYGKATPILFAVTANRANAMRMLLAAGASYHRQGSDYYSPLDSAAYYNASDALRTLLAAGAGEDDKKDSALHAAASNGSITALNILIEAGANVNSYKDHEDIWCSAFNECGLKTNDIYLEMVNILIQAGARLNPDPLLNTRKIFLTPLMHAAENDFTQIMQRLLSAGADLNAVDSLGRTALHHAIMGIQGNAIRFLLKAGASHQLGWTVQKRCYSGPVEKFTRDCTPLHIFAEYNLFGSDILNILEILIAAGCDINARTSEGATPLHEMCRSVDRITCWNVGRLAIMHFYLGAGAVVDAVDHMGESPLHYLCRAIRIAAIERVKHYSDYGGIVDMEKHSDEISALLRVLINYGADVERRDKRGYTPLHCLMNLKEECFRRNMIETTEDLNRCHCLLQPFAVVLLNSGSSSFDALPWPYPGVEKALFEVWRRHPENLHCLISRMSEPTRDGMRAFLCCLHRHLPGCHELQIKILEKGLDGYAKSVVT